MRRLVGKLAADFERTVAPLLPSLRRSVIHNDANDFNVLVGGGSDLYTRNQSVVGLIDFGDMVYSYHGGRPGGGHRVRHPRQARPARGRGADRAPAITQPIPWKKRNSRRCSVW